MKNFKLILTLKNNPQRKKYQSISADSIIEAIQKSERYNPGYEVTEINEYHHILIHFKNNTSICMYVNTEKEKEIIINILRDYISKCNDLGIMSVSRD